MPVSSFLKRDLMLLPHLATSPRRRRNTDVDGIGAPTPASSYIEVLAPSVSNCDCI